MSLLSMLLFLLFMLSCPSLHRSSRGSAVCHMFALLGTDPFPSNYWTRPLSNFVFFLGSMGWHGVNCFCFFSLSHGSPRFGAHGSFDSLVELSGLWYRVSFLFDYSAI